MKDLILSGIRKNFGSYLAVENVSLTFPAGQLTALLGPSGCGKTTLLRLIAGLETPTSGEITLGDQDIASRPAHKRNFGMVFQNFALFPHLNVRDNVCYSLVISGTARPIARAKAEELLDLVKLDGLANRRIGELSGGQCQRVAIARALAQEPELFLLDEPMSALDAKLREEMQIELRMLQQRLGITTIVVTHDQREAMTMADRVVVMSNGRVEQTGSPQDIYHRPENAFVAGFIGKANFFHGILKGDAVICGGITLSVSAPPGIAQGSAMTIACRPEKVCMKQDHLDGNTVSARVVFVRDVGATCDVYLETPLGKIIAESSASDARSSPRLGDRLQLHLPAESLHVYAGVSDQPSA